MKQWKNASMLVFRHITPADFFNIYKKPSAENSGGGQSYIDIATKSVSLAAWQKFFSEITPETMKGGPLWTCEINSLSVNKKQNVKIGQRRSSSVSIREQKLTSRRSNRVYAWDPCWTDFPTPSSNLESSSDPQIEPLIRGLVIFLLRATDGSYWAGWMKKQDRPLSWPVPAILMPMFEKRDGVIEFVEPMDFDEHSLHWPFMVAGQTFYGTNTMTARTSGSITLLGKEPLVEVGDTFRTITEDEITSILFDGDYSDAPVSHQEVVAKIRRRNQKAVRALKILYGECQISGSKYVFEKADGKPYLEVHHLVPLGLGGADRPANLIVVSAHIHRMLHYADVTCIDLSNIDKYELKIKLNDKPYTIRWKSDHAATIENPDDN